MHVKLVQFRRRDRREARIVGGGAVGRAIQGLGKQQGFAQAATARTKLSVAFQRYERAIDRCIGHIAQHAAARSGA